jgi:ketosteroid isomerase-like protein
LTVVNVTMPIDITQTRKMALSKLDGCELPAAADMHVHLRDGAMTELVVYGNPIYIYSYRH